MRAGGVHCTWVVRTEDGTPQRHAAGHCSHTARHAVISRVRTGQGGQARWRTCQRADAEPNVRRCCSRPRCQVRRQQLRSTRHAFKAVSAAARRSRAGTDSLQKRGQCRLRLLLVGGCGSHHGHRRSSADPKPKSSRDESATTASSAGVRARSGKLVARGSRDRGQCARFGLQREPVRLLAQIAQLHEPHAGHKSATPPQATNAKPEANFRFARQTLRRSNRRTQTKASRATTERSPT
jgi:hypothetical protein